MWSRYQNQRSQNSLSREGWYTCSSSLAETEKHPPAAEEGQEFLKVVEDEASGVLPVAVVGQVPRPQQGDKPVEEQVGHKVQRSQFPKGQPKESKLP